MNAQVRESPVREYARLSLMAHRYRAAQQAMPDDLAARIQELEAFAGSTLNAQELYNMGQLVVQEQSRLLADERARNADYDQVMHNAQENLDQALRNRGARIITRTAGIDRDGKGLTESQMHQSFLRGKYTVPGKQPVLVREAAKVTRKSGKQADAADVSTMLLQMGELMDDSQKMDAYLTKQAGDDPTARRILEQRIRTTWTNAELERRHEGKLRERNPDAFKPRDVELTDSEHRRLTIADRIVAHEGPEAFFDVIHDRGKEGSIREALADAFDEAEANDLDPETMGAVRDVLDVGEWGKDGAPA